ncbi:ribonuclease HII [Melissococcus plutonius]|uniref:Ribonuclease HII n=1 Tax=Melissococcus plutonius TaxID=33970 RepID=A0A2Z5Y2E8_9ENTE|nr:ribonuclease HII [Melissococcus plutonius]BAL62068.1 ribonuclease HII [Melissococcus plutonius DAT561]MCV2499192.1 ribonuclease HII [Melissococcus plutonius]MCV2500378.1 ribonuclease HII [Melissococcus plutonius]MCV2505171.1 ribonuclease HII [Melissococcus plutonius]MCV2507697.1 ribonuclease HII [Melissococcus plutonius]
MSKKNSESIQQIKDQLNLLTDEEDPRLSIWQLDQRIGVQKALKQWQNRQKKKQEKQIHYQKMQQFEKKAMQEGYQAIAGIDEVGRGPLAGPVVAAAVILPEDCQIFELNDSKQLSAKTRERLFDEIGKKALAIGIGLVSHETIDEINIYQATKQAMIQAVANLQRIPDYLLIDAMTLPLTTTQQSIIKGDARSLSIAAASIVAKVTRDRLMVHYAAEFPGYGFEKNAGYGTKEHLEGLKKQGISPIHRKTFAPIKTMITI